MLAVAAAAGTPAQTYIRSRLQCDVVSSLFICTMGIYAFACSLWLGKFFTCISQAVSGTLLLPAAKRSELNETMPIRRLWRAVIAFLRSVRSGELLRGILSGAPLRAAGRRLRARWESRRRRSGASEPPAPVAAAPVLVPASGGSSAHRDGGESSGNSNIATTAATAASPPALAQPVSEAAEGAPRLGAPDPGSEGPDAAGAAASADPEGPDGDVGGAGETGVEEDDDGGGGEVEEEEEDEEDGESLSESSAESDDSEEEDIADFRNELELLLDEPGTRRAIGISETCAHRPDARHLRPAPCFSTTVWGHLLRCA